MHSITTLYTGSSSGIIGTGFSSLSTVWLFIQDASKGMGNKWVSGVSHDECWGEAKTSFHLSGNGKGGGIYGNGFIEYQLYV